ncbi:hypothetical protein [Candidatus Protofrankia californiensis]|uniref:hypothetical protein n=1 Tax=Candidatus Protofrankia californiensis TaxID=1839754 RepID=UPI0013ED63DE|nr:hypothetical protein [Candidatus Protofrankia californiensis]
MSNPDQLVDHDEIGWVQRRGAGEAHQRVQSHGPQPVRAVPAHGAQRRHGLRPIRLVEVPQGLVTRPPAGRRVPHLLEQPAHVTDGHVRQPAVPSPTIADQPDGTEAHVSSGRSRISSVTSPLVATTRLRPEGEKAAARNSE